MGIWDGLAFPDLVHSGSLISADFLNNPMQFGGLGSLSLIPELSDLLTGYTAYSAPPSNLEISVPGGTGDASYYSGGFFDTTTSEGQNALVSSMEDLAVKFHDYVDTPSDWIEDTKSGLENWYAKLAGTTQGALTGSLFWGLWFPLIINVAVLYLGYKVINKGLK